MITKFTGELPGSFQKNKDAVYLGAVGSREIDDKQKVLKMIGQFIQKRFSGKNVIIVSGGANGVDSYAEDFAEINGLDAVIIKPDWKRYRGGAGKARNTEIVKVSDEILAFIIEKSGGTWDTIKKAQNANKPVKVIIFQ